MPRSTLTLVLPAVLFAAKAYAAPVTQTIGPFPDINTCCGDFNSYVLGTVTFANGTNEILGLNSSISLADQGWGNTGAEGADIHLQENGSDIWSYRFATAYHDWATVNFDITSN